MSGNKKFSVVIVAIVVVVVLWVVWGFEGNELPYVTIGELKEIGPTKPDKRFRLGGTVMDGSRDYHEGGVSFVLQQDKATLPVTYHGNIVPDMFNTEGAEVIIEGYYQDREFQADNLMTKCASRYEGDLEKAASAAK